MNGIYTDTYAGADGTVGVGGGPVGGTGGEGGPGLTLTGNNVITGTGTVTGGTGGTGGDGTQFGGNGGTGGDGVLVSGFGGVYNIGDVLGGFGGLDTLPGVVGHAGDGGTGVDLTGGGAVENIGFIAGGPGQLPTPGTSEGVGGNGGDGVQIYDPGILVNAAGAIAGGAGGDVGSSFGQALAGAGGIGAQLNGYGTVANAALILGGAGGNANTATSNSTGVGGAGVDLVAGGVLSNGATGAIIGGSGGTVLGDAQSDIASGGGDGADLTNGAVINSGIIAAGAGGSITNATQSLGTVVAGAGGIGVSVAGAAPVLNLGALIGGAGGSGDQAHESGGAGGAGVQFSSFETLNNSGGILGGTGGDGYVASGSGGDGIDFQGGGVLFNSGTIAGGQGGTGAGGTGASGDAAYFGGGTGGSLLVDAPGAVFLGNVVATGSGNAIELGTGAQTGTIENIGTQYTGFDSVLVDSGATWEIGGNSTLDLLVNNGTILEGSGDDLTVNGSIGGTGVIEFDPGIINLNGIVGATQTVNLSGGGDVLNLGDPLQFAGTIVGFDSTDSINLAGVTVTGSSSFNQTTDQLTVDTTTGPLTLQFSGDFTGESFQVSGSGVISIACYRRGTLILTPCGEVAVESLAIGYWVITHTGEAEPIKWIGRRRYDARFVAGKPHVLPIRIQAHALGEGLPTRDLWVSPQHALYLEGVLVPASELLNGLSITQQPVEGELEYIHVELASHALIWAEGVAAETFVDDNSRQLFENAEEYTRLYPDEERHAAQFCGERLGACYEVEALRWRLADRAAEAAGKPRAKAA